MKISVFRSRVAQYLAREPELDFVELGEGISPDGDRPELGYVHRICDHVCLPDADLRFDGFRVNWQVITGHHNRRNWTILGESRAGVDYVRLLP